MKSKKYPKGKALGNTTSMAVASMGVEPKPLKRSKAKIGKDRGERWKELFTVLLYT